MLKTLIVGLTVLVGCTGVSFYVQGERVLPVFGALGALYVVGLMAQAISNWNADRAYCRCRAC